jgi:hypothetical protein
MYETLGRTPLFPKGVTKRAVPFREFKDTRRKSC